MHSYRVEKRAVRKIQQFSDSESFRRWLTDTIFGLTHKDAPAA